MARGTTLEKILFDFRVECRISVNVAHNNQTRDAHVAMLQRAQEFLWDKVDWTHLRVERFVALQAGQYIYDTPSDLPVDRIQKLEVKHDGVYCPLIYGVEAAQYAAYDTDLDERTWPPQRWKITENEDIEIWPIPDSNGTAATKEGYLKFTGIRKLSAFVTDSDRADLDDQVIVKLAAGKYLAATGAKDAQLVLDEANSRLAELSGHQRPRRVMRMFGDGGESRRPRRVPIAVYNSSGS